MLASFHKPAKQAGMFITSNLVFTVKTPVSGLALFFFNQLAADSSGPTGQAKVRMKNHLPGGKIKLSQTTGQH